MSIFDSIEKLVTEHGSAAILQQQLAFAKDQFFDLERKVGELQIQVGRLEAQLERERLEHKQAREDLQRLKDEHSEEVRIHRLIEFRRGKRTGGKWMAFCPKCHMPVGDSKSMAGNPQAFCTAKHADCGWHVYPPMTVAQIIQELEA
ncbi:MAG: hypothetical protein AB1813_16370 [Verrucomicrobiota bacterium]